MLEIIINCKGIRMVKEGEIYMDNNLFDYFENLRLNFLRWVSNDVVFLIIMDE